MNESKFSNDKIVKKLQRKLKVLEIWDKVETILPLPVLFITVFMLIVVFTLGIEFEGGESYIGISAVVRFLPTLILFALMYHVIRFIYWKTTRGFESKIKHDEKRIARTEKMLSYTQASIERMEILAAKESVANDVSDERIKEMLKGGPSETATEANNTVNFDTMSGEQFEHFCADLLLKNGFEKAEVTQLSGDYGIDILAEKDGITYAVQCKCYSSNIGNGAVQEAYSGKEMYKRMVAVVMTNQYFTPAAKKTAEETRVLLWDRDVLLNMIAKANHQ